MHYINLYLLLFICVAISFIINTIVNRFLFRLCIIRSVLYAFFSLFLLLGVLTILSIKG
ncbi:hypothetical protein GWK41_03835 [Persephonella atlantica]|uniref:DUF1656 domain-containing protein n=1 Tax=Persephonella atlantica TaxID=2699429 RepID=A0ABS1GGZ1_9AQUI|nr:hypothetical protein [Persephonella atlantica]MBK3332198.1 hypothetical protein [Persephonella atlantica]